MILRCMERTIHELLNFESSIEVLLPVKKMQGQEMESCAALMTFHGDWAGVVLDCEVIAYRTRPITDESLCVFKSSSRD